MSDDDDFDPAEAALQISEFIAAADELSGPSVDAVVDAVAVIVGRTYDEIDALTLPVPHNKVLAVMLAMSRRAQEATPGSREQWEASAASTILSGMIGRGQQVPTDPAT